MNELKLVACVSADKDGEICTDIKDKNNGNITVCIDVDDSYESFILCLPEMYAEIESDLADLVYELEYCEPVYEHQIEKLKSKIDQKTKLLAKARGEQVDKQ